MGATSIRQQLEDREDAWLRPEATRSATAIRARTEPESPLRTAFQRDRDRVTHAKAFRRLQRKTQVVIAPGGDHYRTRLTHTLEVTQIARTVSRALRLNEDLTEAIGLAHDLGHTPFGHAGERALSDVFPGFRHNEQSLRVVDRIERDGQGLNLTDPVRDGILRHSKPQGAVTGEVAGRPGTPEAQVVKLSDAVAYVNHDLDDALRAGLIAAGEVPRRPLDQLGTTHASRINTLVSDIVSCSAAPPSGREDSRQMIVMSGPVRAALDELRDFLFARVYTPLNQAERTLQAQRIVRWLFEHYVAHPEEVPGEFARALGDDGVERVAADFVASMTDRYALDCFERLYVPRHWSL